jgi:hypothetical protein
MIPSRRPGPWVDTVDDTDDPDRLGVFVPTIMGAGLIMSLVVFVADQTSRLRSRRARERQRAVMARRLALQTVGVAPDAAEPADLGLRRRWVYAVLGGALVGLAVYGFVGSFWNYWNPVHPWRGIGWIWAVSNVAVVALGWAGIAIARIGFGWPRVEPSAWPFLLRLPLVRHPAPLESVPAPLESVEVVEGAAPAEPTRQA